MQRRWQPCTGDLSAWQRFEFLDDAAGANAARSIVEHLQRGNHVVLEFGQYGRNEAAYVLVSNLLTRRIHEEWVRRKELADGGQGADPRPLVIFIEEAHKFLTPEVASQTIFGTIAPGTSQVQCNPDDCRPASQWHRL